MKKSKQNPLAWLRSLPEVGITKRHADTWEELEARIDEMKRQIALTRKGQRTLVRLAEHDASMDYTVEEIEQAKGLR